VKPSPARTALLGAVRATNALLRDDARRDTLATYVDVHTPMLGTDGARERSCSGPTGST
jgi:hypothetical protein